MSNLMLRETPNLISLRSAMDRLFDESFLRPLGEGLTGWNNPAVDLVETPNEFVLQATLPGMKPEDVKINVIGDTVEIIGEVKEESEHKEGTWHLRERRAGSFQRRFTLPVSVMADTAKAEFENGVLTLTLPKAEAAKPKMITIKAKK